MTYADLLRKELKTMNITLTPPPELTGNNENDLKELREWCLSLHSQLKRTLYNLDTSNILEVSGELINGNIPLDSVTVSGGKVKIAKDSISIKNSNGSQYLTLSGDTLTFCGKVISQ